MNDSDDVVASLGHGFDIADIGLDDLVITLSALAGGVYQAKPISAAQCWNDQSGNVAATSSDEESWASVAHGAIISILDDIVAFHGVALQSCDVRAGV
jgi:hypothetical protein